MLLIPRVPQPWPRILGQRSALSRGMPGNSRQVHAQSLCGTASLEAGMGKGQRFYGHKFVGEGASLLASMNEVAREALVGNRNDVEVIQFGTAEPRLTLPTGGRIRFLPGTGVALSSTQSPTFYRITCDPDRTPLPAGPCVARSREGPSPQEGALHPPRVGRYSHWPVSNHTKKPQPNLHQLVEEGGDANSESSQPNCLHQVAIKCLGAFCQSLFDLLGEQSHL